MLNLGKVCVAIGLMCGMTWGAGVKASVDTVEVVEGNAVQLYLKATGGRVAFPDIDMVADAPVIGRSRSSSHNLSIINGVMEQEQTTTQILEFIPKQSMTIPSYVVQIGDKSYQTEPIEITVLHSSTPPSVSATPYSLRMKTQNTQVSVGESFAVSVYFAIKNDIKLSQNVQYTPPTFTGFTASDGAQQQPYIKGDYKIQEVQYILTANTEGNYSITPARAAISLPDTNTRDIFGMGFGTQWNHISSNTLGIEVKPQTKQSDLLGDFTLTSHLDAQETKANKPVNLIVTIEGKGSLENFEYPKYEIDGVTVYSDEAKRETSVVNGELHSKYTKSFAFISEEDFNIPERSFTALKPGEDTLKTLTVKGHNVTIKKSAKTEMPEQSKQTHSVVQSNTEKPIKEKKEIIAAEKTLQTGLSWWMLALAFVLGGVSVATLKYLPKRLSEKSFSDDEPLKILYAHISEDSAVEEMVRKLYAKKRGDKTVQIDKKTLRQMLERFM